MATAGRRGDLESDDGQTVPTKKSDKGPNFFLYRKRIKSTMTTDKTTGIIFVDTLHFLAC